MTDVNIMTSLAAIHKAGPYLCGWTQLCKHLGKSAAEARVDTTEFPLLTVLDSNGIDDCLWVLDNAVKNRRIASLFAADCALHVHHLFAEVFPDDDRPMNAIRVAKDLNATDEQRAAARAAARDAAGDAGAAWAARDAARDAAWAAARDAAGDARDAAWDAARDAWAAARAAARAAGADQTYRLRQYLTYGEAASEMAWPATEEVAA